MGLSCDTEATEAMTYGLQPGSSWVHRTVALAILLTDEIDD